MGPVLLTRPLDDSRRIAGMLEADGIDSLIWPLTEIRPVAPDSTIPLGIGGLLITSAHGIRAFAALDKRRDVPVLCVGTRTADVARSLGFALVLSADGDGEALARLAPGTGIRHFLYPRGRETSHDLAAMLARGGQRVSDMILYEATQTGPPAAPIRSALLSGRVSAVTLWSARNAALFADWVRSNASEDLFRSILIAISWKAAEPLQNTGFKTVRVAEQPDAAAMANEIRLVFASLSD